MKKNIIIGIFIMILILTGTIVIINLNKDEKALESSTSDLEAVVLSHDNNTLTVQDNNNIIYTLAFTDHNIEVGSTIVIEYTGSLNKNIQLQEVKIVGYETKEKKLNENGIDEEWLDNGIFGKYYVLANNRMKKMTLDEKIAQLLLVRYTDDSTAANIQQKYQFGGYVFFTKDFEGKTEQEVKNMINKVQEVSNIPMLTAVDEEGGNVIRVSSNPNLVATPFKSPSELYAEGAFDVIKNDTIKKSTILGNLGLNLNLAPVVDVSTDTSDYMYNRALQQDTILTSEYAKTVIKASKSNSVSYTLKHFPGYGNNNDTHTGEVVDNRTYESIIQNDLPPFEAGIDAGAEAILINHNIVVNIDKDNPASLSPTIHNLLRNELGFTGVIITDDLAMGAIDNIENPAVKAIQAGNDIIITTYYEESFNSIKNAVENGTISEDTINRLAFRVLAWKYYKGLIYDNNK